MNIINVSAMILIIFMMEIVINLAQMVILAMKLQNYVKNVMKIV